MITVERLEEIRQRLTLTNKDGDKYPQETDDLVSLAKIALTPPQDVAGIVEELRGLVEKATPGPWTYETDDEGSSMGWIDYQPHDVASRSLFDVCGDSAQQAMNAEYVAAANPANITKLLDCVTSLSARNRELEAENADMKTSVIAFAGPFAAEHAKLWGLPKNHLFPTHYDILEKCGARMVDFIRADEAAIRALIPQEPGEKGK